MCPQPASQSGSFNTVERVREEICFLSLCLLLLVSVVVDVVFLLLGVLVVGKFLELFLFFFSFVLFEILLVPFVVSYNGRMDGFMD